MCRKVDENTKNKLNSEISQTNTSSKKCLKLLKQYSSSSTLGADGPISDNGVIITDNFVKAEILNNCFVSQTILDELSTPPPTEPPNAFSSLKIDQLVVQPEVIYKIVSQLNISKATGPDGIGNLILREAAVPLAEPLSNLFNYCISLGYFPELWKIANVLNYSKWTLYFNY